VAEVELKERLATLETKLITPGQMLGNYADLPYAIYWYPPHQEWTMRAEIRRLAVRVHQKTEKEVITISLADLLWQAIDETVGLKELAEAERGVGFGPTQDTVNAILSRDRPLPDLLADRMANLREDHHIVFLTRAAAFAPLIYQMSALLDQLKLHQIRIPTVLFYPGRRDGPTTLVFMELPDREAMGNYFVPIY
jgi:hypothetical protein